MKLGVTRTMNKTDKKCFTWLQVNNFTTLEDINEQFTQRHLGGIIFIGILMVLGVFGNLIVLFLYIRRFKMSNYRTYAVWLAIMDIGNSCTGMPFLIFHMSHYLIFPSSGLCKLGRFIMVFTTNCSAYILVVIACDRYRKICKSLEWQFSQRHAKFSCIIASCIGFITSWPTLVLYGIYTGDAVIPNVRGERCWTDDDYRDTVYPSIYYIGLYILNFSVVPILLVAYIQILRFLHQPRSSGIHINTRNTTVTLLAVTVAFLLSALPHYSMVITTRIQNDFNCKMSFSQGFAYYTFVFSILLNNSVNPFIYGFLDKKFRKEIKFVCGDLLSRGVRKRDDVTSSSVSESNNPDVREVKNVYSLQEMNSEETYLDN